MANIKHGMSKSKSYYRHATMMSRCYNKKYKTFHNYGGRGIKVCKRWHDFVNFLKDVGEPPFASATLDRIDNNGDYCPENCRWATYRQQANNKRSNRIIEYNGEFFTLAELSRKLNLSMPTLWMRLKNGVKVDRNLRPVSKELVLNIYGELVLISEASRRFKIKSSTILKRVNRGWSHIDAVTKPVKNNGYKKNNESSQGFLLSEITQNKCPITKPIKKVKAG